MTVQGFFCSSLPAAVALVESSTLETLIKDEASFVWKVPILAVAFKVYAMVLQLPAESVCAALIGSVSVELRSVYFFFMSKIDCFWPGPID